MASNVMELTPWPYDAEADAERKLRGERGFFLAIGPTVNGFEFIEETRRLPAAPEMLLSDKQVAIASAFAGADGDNPWLKSHLEFLQRVLSLIKHGDGSALLLSNFGKKSIEAAATYPELLFKPLDDDWQQFAMAVEQNRFGFQVPPVLGIVLSRCARRDDIPAAIKDLRDEWSDARRKVWRLIDGLKVCETIGEAREIERELSDASHLFAPRQKAELDSTPIRILWEITAAGAAGMVIAEASGASRGMGALAGGVN